METGRRRSTSLAGRGRPGSMSTSTRSTEERSIRSYNFESEICLEFGFGDWNLELRSSAIELTTNYSDSTDEKPFFFNYPCHPRYPRSHKLLNVETLRFSWGLELGIWDFA